LLNVIDLELRSRKLLPLLVFENLPWTLPALQRLNDLISLRILHLLPEIFDHPIYILSVLDSLRETFPADHLGP
jgi:hypothetical protein